MRATRRWALTEAAAVAGFAILIGLAFTATIAAALILVVVALVIGGLIYRSETRIIRRRLAVMAQPFPAEWAQQLGKIVPYYATLAPAERERFQHLVAIFLDEKPIHGIGCTIDDTTRLLVAASATIPVFAFPAWEYATLRKVLIRPEAFDATFQDRQQQETMALGMVGASGLFDGVMILSLPDLYAGFAPNAGKHNVGIHEFSHLIDQNNGAIDGIPASLPRECLQPWTTLVHDHLAHHRGDDAGIPAYGYTNEAEFFAVASEYFFQSPEEMARRDPELYALLEQIFQQRLLGKGLRRMGKKRTEGDGHSG